MLVSGDGRTFSWYRENMLGGLRTFATVAGPLVNLAYCRDREGISKLEAFAGVTPAGSREPHLTLLLVTGWFLMAQAVFDHD